MAELPPLVVRVTADTKSLASGLSGATKTTSAFSKASALAYGVAGAAVLKFGVDSVKAFLESEKAVFQWEQAVRHAVGISADFTEAGIELASGLQSVTGFQDEAILGVETVLSRFKLEEDQLRTLTPLVLDYARATGMDAVSAAESIGKALLGNARALKSVGINFTATGDRVQDTTDLITLLDQAIGGTAKAFGETLPGQMEIAQAHFDEFKEQVGSIPATIYDFAINGAKAGDILSDTFRQMAIDAGLAHEPVEDAAVILRDYALAAEIAGRATGAFAGMSISEFKDWRNDVTGAISAVEDAFDVLGNKAKVTADKVINTFLAQANAVRDYDHNLQTLAANGVGERILQYLIDQGPAGVAVIDRLANTHGAAYSQMLAAIRSAIAADKEHRAVITGLRNDLQTLPSDVYTTIHISTVGGIPAGVGGGLGGPGPGGQIGSATGWTGTTPTASRGLAAVTSGRSGGASAPVVNVSISGAGDPERIAALVEERVVRGLQEVGAT